MSLLSLGAAAMIATAEAAELPYDVQGGEAFEMSASGYKVEENGVVYLALTNVADSAFRDALLYLMGEGNNLNKTDAQSTVLFRLGCAGKSGIENEDLALNTGDQDKIWRSTATNPVQVVLNFEVGIGTDGKCTSLAEGVRVTHSTTDTVTSR